MKRLGYLSVFATTLIWGFSFVSIKISLEVFSPTAIIFYSYILASLFFMGMMVKTKEGFKIDKADIFLLLKSSIFGVVLYFYAEIIGVDLLNASTASVILSLVPIVIMISNYFLYRERLSKVKMGAIFISVIGIMILFSDSLSFQGEGLVGYISMFAAILLWAYFSGASAKLTKKYSELKISSFQSFIALLVFAPFMLFQQTDYSAVTYIHWMNILYLGLISSAVGFYLYVYSIKKIGATETSLFVNFIPVVTFFFGFLLLNETMKTNQIIGGLIIIIAMSYSVVSDLKINKKYNHEVLDY